VPDADFIEEVHEFEILDLDRICHVDSVRILLEYFQEMTIDHVASIENEILKARFFLPLAYDLWKLA
jgi:hypothetical protein